jgi:hypothetical protein
LLPLHAGVTAMLAGVACAVAAPPSEPPPPPQAASALTAAATTAAVQPDCIVLRPARSVTDGAVRTSF